MNSLFPWFDVSNATNWLIALALAIFVAFGIGCGEHKNGATQMTDNATANRIDYTMQADGEVEPQFIWGMVGKLGESVHFRFDGKNTPYPPWTAEELNARAAARDAGLTKQQDAAIQAQKDKAASDAAAKAAKTATPAK